MSTVLLCLSGKEFGNFFRGLSSAVYHNCLLAGGFLWAVVSVLAAQLSRAAPVSYVWDCTIDMLVVSVTIVGAGKSSPVES